MLHALQEGRFTCRFLWGRLLSANLPINGWSVTAGICTIDVTGLRASFFAAGWHHP